MAFKSKRGTPTRNARNRTPRIKAIDFFCGAGGLTRGLLDSGIQVVAGIDNNPNCKFPYEANNEGAVFINQKIEDVSAGSLQKKLNNADGRVLVGCAPCQPFSSYTTKTRKTKKSIKNAGNWNLINHFIDKVKKIKPDVLSMENVPQLAKQQVFDDFIDSLKKMKYHVWYDVINCRDYGIPQSRRRLVLLAAKHKQIKISPPAKRMRKRTLHDVIGRLPQLMDGEQNTNDSLHIASKLSDINKKRIKASKQGGTWKDWPKRLLPVCYTKDTGQTYRNVYGRLSWHEPAPTITGQFYRYGTGRFGHPEQNRALSLREGALIQTFRKDYKFVPPKGQVIKTQIGLFIGNAVPVDLGKIIGLAIMDYFKEVSDAKR